MKALSAILAIIVLVLWLASATYIAAPANVISLLPSVPMGNVPPAFLGVLLFLVSIIVIVFWAGMSPEETSEEKEEKATDISQ